MSFELCILEMKQSVNEVIKYAIVGVVGLAVEWSVFFLVRDFFYVNYIVANVISCICGIINNFFLNSYFTFKATDKIWTRAASFFSIAGIGIVLGVFILPLLVRLINIVLVEPHFLDISQKIVQNIAKLMTTVVIACIQFVFNKYITFKKRTPIN